MIHTRFKTCSGNTPRRTPAHQTKSTKCCGRLLVKVNVHEYASMLWVSFVKHQQPDRKIVYPSAPKILQRNRAQCCQCTGCRCTFMLHLHSCSPSRSQGSWVHAGESWEEGNRFLINQSWRGVQFCVLGWSSAVVRIICQSAMHPAINEPTGFQKGWHICNNW